MRCPSLKNTNDVSFISPNKIPVFGIGADPRSLFCVKF
jgi:hypothetical protein